MQVRQVSLLNPDSIALPLGAYSHGVLAQGAGSWLYISGQIGLAPDGTLARDFVGQAEHAWTNLQAVLLAASMDVSNLVKVTTYITCPDDLPRLNPVRSKFLGDTRPSSTLIVVNALAHADWLIEVEAVAFKAAEG